MTTTSEGFPKLAMSLGKVRDEIKVSEINPSLVGWTVEYFLRESTQHHRIYLGLTWPGRLLVEDNFNR